MKALGLIPKKLVWFCFVSVESVSQPQVPRDWCRRVTEPGSWRNRAKCTLLHWEFRREILR